MRDGKAGPGGGPGMCGGRRLPSCPELRGLPAGSPELKHPRLVKRPTNGDGARRDAEQGWRRPGALLGRRRLPSAADPPLSGGAPRQHGSRAAADGVIYGGGGRKVRLHFWNGGGEGYENVSYKSEKPRPLSSPANPAQCPALVSALPAPLPQPRSSCRRGQQSPWGRGRRGAPWLGWLLPTPVPGGHSRTVLRAASPPAVLPGCLAGGPREGAAARPANVGRISGPGQKKEPKHNMSSAHAHTDTQPSHWAAWGRLVCPCGRGSPGHRNWHASPSRGRWGREELPRLGRRGALAGHRSWEK